jgi:hypothetical protein
MALPLPTPPGNSASRRACSCRKSRPPPKSPGSAPTARMCRSEARLTPRRRKRCDAFVAESGALLIHPYDAPETVVGSGTVALEWEEDFKRLAQPGLNTVLVAVGGGGLVAGVAAWFAGRVRVVGVEPEGSHALYAALQADAPVDVSVASIAADSLGAKRVGVLNFDICRRCVSEVVLVSDEAIVPVDRSLCCRRARWCRSLRRPYERRISGGERRARRGSRLWIERRSGGAGKARPGSLSPGPPATERHVGHCDAWEPELLSAGLSAGRVLTRVRFGASPSGKAADFDSAIRRFESSRPSHAFSGLGDFATTGARARIPWAFADAEIGDRLEMVCERPIGRPVSNLEIPISGICPRALPRPVCMQRGPVRNASRRPSTPLNEAGLAERGRGL